MDNNNNNNIDYAPKKPDNGIKSRNKDRESIRFTLNNDSPSTPKKGQKT